MASILKVDTIQDQSGNNIINESGDTITIGASGDTITVPTGASLTVPNGGLSGQNYPAFQAKLSANQEVTDNTDTKVQFDTEVFDTNGYYDNVTNYRFTPLVAGKYYIYLNLGVNGKANNNLNVAYSYIYKNGSRVALGHANYNNNPPFYGTQTAFAIIDMNGSTDYIEAYGKGDVGSGGARFDGNDFSIFGAYRIGA